MLAEEPADADAASAAAHPDAVVQGDGWRVTVLTSRLLRLEHSPTGTFTDEPTQLVLNRRFDVPDVTVSRTDGGLDLWTEHLHLRYDGRPFSAAGLSVSMRTRVQGTHRTTWHFGDPVRLPGGRTGNLWGTARTLDDVDGPTDLEPGLLSRHGYAVVDDSSSLLMTEDGWVRPRPAPQQDLYVFGHGRDYTAALQDFFRLSGPSPLLPRWSLGNWWSRYHRYSAPEYLALMDRFADEGIPFAVAVLDMDWHLVDIDPALGTGWTGYTWDRTLFPDPEGFLAALHDRDLHVALNVHPADGVRRHEAAYADVAQDLGLDPATGLEIDFDITSREFVDTYLRRLHHPHEEIGVDFWWLDWQSGSTSRLPGLDPLWMLNHVHHRDSARDGARPLTFSRYAGLGSHRYPVGFSGDTLTTWASLAFQPYFTATAANVGYFWWSHDVGGHLGGTKDDELAVRWFQLGALSPVNRLHSSSSLFNSKEPWRFGVRAERTMARFLRLRHQLVPYLYSAAWVSHTDGVAPVRPMYHDHPLAPEAYEVPHQYLLGPDLLVAPITTPADRGTHLAAVAAWLPDGTWYDLEGRRYGGGRRLTLHRPLEEMPVLVRAGAVVPLAADPMLDVSVNPESLVLLVAPGADGEAVLREDDGRGAPAPADCQRTTFRTTWRAAPSAADGHGEDVPDDGGDLVLTVLPPTGPGVLTRRTLTVEVLGVTSAAEARAHAAGRSLAVGHRPGAGRRLVVELGQVDLTHGLEVHLTGLRRARQDVAEQVFAILDRAEIAYDTKDRVHAVLTAMSGTAALAALATPELPGNLFGAVLEVVAAPG